ncbi:SDR family oxidoreductase [Nocardioides sp. GY 10113]|uniref:SDR family oxidoreductase n=1 Tax=Nocardioides sp. GY 10113 TaxID=2569761 RepID=UPI0010A79A1A|nr:SDR family oxidoreductase [Nocardioides sp. GY 10113]TIC88225.1 SDR family oxidoreductase [Nocardioides sp. GY 10113]
MGRYDHPERRPAVIAGASSGIGAETAQALAAAGFPVALGARRVDRIEELAATIRSAGGEAVAHPLDVADDGSVADFAAKVAADLGDVEVVVSNAGLLGPGALAEIDTDRLARELDVNLLGPHRLIRAFVPGMVERARGDIVFVSSDTAVRARPFMGGYSASKAGLEGLVGSLQMELEGTGVRASVVRPGPTWSEMGMDWDPDAAAKVLNEWVKWGHARHSHFLKARAIADAITTVVSAPRGVHISPVDVNPEAPVDTSTTKEQQA